MDDDIPAPKRARYSIVPLQPTPQKTEVTQLSDLYERIKNKDKAPITLAVTEVLSKLEDFNESNRPFNGILTDAFGRTIHLVVWGRRGKDLFNEIDKRVEDMPVVNIYRGVVKKGVPTSKKSTFFRQYKITVTERGSVRVCTQNIKDIYPAFIRPWEALTDAGTPPKKLKLAPRLTFKNIITGLGGVLNNCPVGTFCGVITSPPVVANSRLMYTLSDTSGTIIVTFPSNTKPFVEKDNDLYLFGSGFVLKYEFVDFFPIPDGKKVITANHISTSAFALCEDPLFEDFQTDFLSIDFEEENVTTPPEKPIEIHFV